MIMAFVLAGLLIVGLVMSLLQSRPEPYDPPSIEAIDPGLQFQSQYNTKTSQVGVPLIFGTVRVTGNIIYENIGGEQNDMLYTAVGIGEAMLVSSIGDVYVDDMLWTTLPTTISKYSNLSKITDGSEVKFTVSSAGTHGFGYQFDTPGDEEVTYKITIYATSCQVSAYFLCYTGSEAVSFGYSFYYKTVDEETWHLFQNAFEADYSFTYNGTLVPHSWEQDQERTLNQGEYLFKIVCNAVHVTDHAEQKDDDGNDTWEASSFMRFDSLWLSDNGKRETIKYPQTAYVFTELKRDQCLLGSTTIQADTTGVYSNPATCIYQILTNAHWGAGIDPDYISSTSLTAAEAFCDTWGYTYNRCVGSKMNLRDILSEMCLCGRLMILDYGGEIHVQANDDAAAVKTITDDDIIDLQYARGSVANAPTRIVAKFNDAEQDFTVQDVIAEDVSIQTARGYSKELVINLTGVTDRNVAQSLAMFNLMNATNDQTVVIRTNINHSDLRPADVINITSTDAGWVARPHRIMAIDEGDDYDITLTCVPHIAEIYSALYKNTYTKDNIRNYETPKPSVYQTSLPNCVALATTGPNYNIGETISADYVFSFTKPTSLCDVVEVWLSRGTTGVNTPNAFKKIGTASSEFKYIVEEFFVRHTFKFVSRYGSRVNKLTESPTVVLFPPPLKDIGLGVGNFGNLWWGY